MNTACSYLLRSLLLLTLYCLAACAGPRYHQDFLPNTDFSQLKTYQWRKVTSDIHGTNSQHLQTLATQQLATQGYTLDSNAPDMLVDLTFIAVKHTDISRSVGFSVGVPVGSHGGVGIGAYRTLPNDKFEGVIVTDFIAAASHQALWRGTAEQIPTHVFLPANEAQLQNVLNALFRQFPPHQ